MTSKTSANQKILNALANWLTTTREHAPLLDDVADALLNQLDNDLQQDNCHQALAHLPRTLGLYGYSQPGKAELISVLTGNETGHITIAPAGKRLNYLAHINPSHAATRMAVRFSSSAPRLPAASASTEAAQTPPLADDPLFTNPLFTDPLSASPLSASRSSADPLSTDLLSADLLSADLLSADLLFTDPAPRDLSPASALPAHPAPQPQSAPTARHNDWPLTLRLFSEAELVQLFIQHHLRQPQPVRPLTDAQIQQRIRQLQPLRQPQISTAISQPEIAALAAEYALITRTDLQPASWRQLITLLPQLNLSERAELYSLFWSEQRQLTHHWLQLAQTLQALGNVREIAAPLSLIVDNFSLPVEGLLNGELTLRHLLVCPLPDSLHRLPAVSVDAQSLVFLAAELILPLANNPILPGTDLLDIPGAPHDHSLANSKIHFLLDYYRQHQQPDILLICNAADNIRHTTHTAARLLRWQQHTQPAHDNARPGLIWTITAHDLRFKDGLNPDENIQRLLGKPGERWATLQALESRNLQRMTEWLAAALGEQQSQRRHQALNLQLQQHLQQTFLPFTTPAKASDSQALAQLAIRELQQQAIHHGDLLEALMPDAALLQSLCQPEPHPATTSPQNLFNTDIDLFTGQPQPAEDNPARASDSASRVYRYWINHVRQWTQQPRSAQQLNLSPDSLRWLGDTLIITSYRLNLQQSLQTASRQSDQPAARLRAEIGDFISWLGYARTPLSERPASRINQGAVIFQPATQPPRRLTRLPDQPAHAATRYVYDWLIALYSHAQQNAGYHHPLDLKPTHRANLKKLLKKLAPIPGE